jgi:hypothetical protein
MRIAPNRHGELASNGADGQIDRPFARQRLPAPLSQSALAGAQDCLGAFDEQSAQHFIAVSADAATPLGFSAVIKGRV